MSLGAKPVTTNLDKVAQLPVRSLGRVPWAGLVPKSIANGPETGSRLLVAFGPRIHPHKVSGSKTGSVARLEDRKSLVTTLQMQIVIARRSWDTKLSGAESCKVAFHNLGCTSFGRLTKSLTWVFTLPLGSKWTMHGAPIFTSMFWRRGLEIFL